MKIAIIGGGMIGLAVGYHLSKQGAAVQVIDAGDPGMACSLGNLGWLCPSLSEPVPAPGVVSMSLRWLLHGDGPLYIRPSAVPQLLPWLVQFWRHCSPPDYAYGRDALMALSRSSLSAFDTLAQDGVDCELHRQGLLLVFADRQEMRRRWEELAPAADFGYVAAQALTQAEVLDLEPALSSRVIGGMMLPGEYHVRADTLSRALAQRIIDRGGLISARTQVADVEVQGGSVRSLMTSSGQIQADAYVLAAGAWSAALARKVGYHLPVTAGKGYSVTIDAPRVRFHRPLYFGETRAGLSPYVGSVRIGGTMELSGINSRLDLTRVAAVRRAVRSYLGDDLEGEAEAEWVGLRPMTADGLPVLGPVPGHDNFYVATGHAMMGISLSQVTGALMARLILGGSTDLDLTPFSPARFSPRRAR